MQNEWRELTVLLLTVDSLRGGKKYDRYATFQQLNAEATIFRLIHLWYFPAVLQSNLNVSFRARCS